MFDYAVKELLPIVGGRLVRGSGEVRIACAAIDSRNAGPGAAFFAFRGQHRDGHDFVAQAASAGAAAAVVSHALGDEVLEALPEGFALIHVDDSLQALTALAAEHRRRSNARVVAITGSAGKTTTKDMTAAVLGRLRVVATEGNMNNEIGMPLTLLRLEPQHQAIVLEMAMRARGEIAQLAAVAKPEIGVVINVGTAHLGELGSQENIAAAKAELVTGPAARGRRGAQRRRSKGQGHGSWPAAGRCCSAHPTAATCAPWTSRRRRIPPLSAWCWMAVAWRA